MIAGLVVVPVVSLLTPKLSKERVEDIFNCLDTKGTGEQKLALPDEED